MKRIMKIKHMNRDLSIKSLIKFLLVSGILTISGYAGAETISGIVRDAGTKKPISAARVVVISKNVSVVTDENGRFTMDNVSPKDVLSVEAYDFGTREISVRNQKVLTVDLYSDVFTNFYKQIDNLTETSSTTVQTASIKSMKGIEQSPAFSVDELFQTSLGADARSITRSGITGIGASLFIRGINSVNVNAQPLFVVDGVIWNNMYDMKSIEKGYFSNVLDYIDVNDIESMTVVKDGTSIYGSKGSNGVILIKTKRSSSQVTKIGVNVSTSFTNTPGSYPMMNGEAYRIYATDLLGTAGMDSRNLSSFNYLVTDKTNPVYNTYHNNTDWADEVYRIGQGNHYMISAMGGDEKALYYFSVGLTNDKGIVKSTDLTRINTLFNADIHLTKDADLGLNIGFTHMERNMVDDGVNFYSSPTWLANLKSPFFSPHKLTSTGNVMVDYADADDFGIGNPSAVIENALNAVKQFRINVDANPTYRINPNLTLNSQFDYSLMQNNERRFVPMNGTAPEYLEKWGGYSTNEVNSQVLHDAAIFNDTRLKYKKQFGNHHLNAVYGLRFIVDKFESDYAEEHNTGADNNTTITGSYDFLTVDGLNNNTKSLSNYLQAEYNYDNRYFATAATSMDASSRFGKETKGGFQMLGTSWGVFPSINLGWLASSESFMKPLDFINLCKVRLGYGLTGNDGIPDYEAMSYFTYTRFLKQANGIVIGNIANEELQWETTRRANLGLDLGLFNERLGVTFDYYSGVTDNLLVLKDALPTTGVGTYWGNDGKMTNNGFELSTTVKALNLKHVKLEVGLNVGHYKNKVTALPSGQFTTSVYGGGVLTAVGEPVGAFFW